MFLNDVEIAEFNEEVNDSLANAEKILGGSALIKGGFTKFKGRSKYHKDAMKAGKEAIKKIKLTIAPKEQKRKAVKMVTDGMRRISRNTKLIKGGALAAGVLGAGLVGSGVYNKIRTKKKRK